MKKKIVISIIVFFILFLTTSITYYQSLISVNKETVQQMKASILIQKIANQAEEKFAIQKEKEKIQSEFIYSSDDLMGAGAIYYGDWKWTWYSQNVLPGEGLDIPGRHVDENGYVCDGEGYICLASGSLSKGTIVDTPFGKKGKIYDCGCAANVLDVYTNF